MAESLITALSELDTQEVSLVTEGANRKRFALSKEDGPEAVLEVCLETECAEEQAIAKSGAPDRVQLALRKAVRALTAFRDELPETGKSALSALIGDGMSETQTVETPAPDAGAQERELIEKAAQERIAKAEARAADAEAALAKQLEAERRREYLAKAVTLKSIPGSTEENAELLRRVADVDPDLGAQLEAKMIALNAQISQSALLTQVGTSQPGETQKSAMDEANTRATELSVKEGISKAVAFARIVKADTDLRKRIRAEEAR